MSAPTLSPDPWLTLVAEVAAPLRLGSPQGYERRCVPILGGQVAGRFAGRVLAGGADWQRVLADGTTELEAHYTIETDAGEAVEVFSNGLRTGPEPVMRALLAGEAVDPAQVYFRSAMRFVTAAPRLRLFAQRLFVGVGRREPDRVLLDVHAVL